MNHYAIFFIGCFIGTCFGLLLAGLLGMGHRQEREQELYDAYQEGRYDERRDNRGIAKPGATLVERVKAMDRGVED